MTQNGFLGKKVLLKRWSYLLWIVRDFFGHREAPTDVKIVFGLRYTFSKIARVLVQSWSILLRLWRDTLSCL